MKETQNVRPTVTCEGTTLKNVTEFKYLGSIYVTNGKNDRDVSRHITLATQICGQLRQVFSANNITQVMKIKIYKAVVVSVLAFGCEV